MRPFSSPQLPSTQQDEFSTSSLNMVAAITQPLPPITGGRRRHLLEAGASDVALATPGRSLLQSNSISMAPISIPLQSVTGSIVVYSYGSFTGTPSVVSLDSYTPPANGDPAATFTVSGSGVASNCVSSAFDPGVACPSSDSYTFTLTYSSPPAGATNSGTMTLSFLPTSDASQPVVTETYFFLATPFDVLLDGGAIDIGNFGRRLRQVQPLDACHFSLTSPSQVFDARLSQNPSSTPAWMNSCQEYEHLTH